MDDKTLVAVVNGYGCHLYDAKGRPTPLLDPYLLKVIRFKKERRPDYMIFCGSFTQAMSAPGVSEACLMAACVYRNSDNSYTQILVEDRYYTTYFNSKFSAELIRSEVWQGQPLRIVGFCEATRAANVVMLGRRFYKDFLETIDDFTVETASWERADPFKQAGNLIYNRCALEFPYLAEREQKRRIQRAQRI